MIEVVISRDGMICMRIVVALASTAASTSMTCSTTSSMTSSPRRNERKGRWHDGLLPLLLLLLWLIVNPHVFRDSPVVVVPDNPIWMESTASAATCCRTKGEK